MIILLPRYSGDPCRSDDMKSVRFRIRNSTQTMIKENSLTYKRKVREPSVTIQLSQYLISLYYMFRPCTPLLGTCIYKNIERIVTRNTKNSFIKLRSHSYTLSYEVPKFC